MKNLYRTLLEPSSSLSLNVFRRFFGLINVILIIRYFTNGWIKSYFKDPLFHFHHYGMSWIRPLPYEAMLVIFVTLLILSIFIVFDYYSKFSLIVYTFLFSWFHFSDATIYLNHYYLISVIGLLLCFLPNQLSRNEKIPFFYIVIFRIQLGIVYFYGGIAKLNSDWMWKALPLSLWLQQVEGKIGIPFIENILILPFTAYLFSWFGIIFDLTIAFALAFAKDNKIYFYFVIIIFHSLTSILFPIGVFPLVMVLLSSIFFSPDWPSKIMKRMKSQINKVIKVFLLENHSKTRSFQLLDESTNVALQNDILINRNLENYNFKSFKSNKLKIKFLVIFLLIQMMLPLRSFAYSGSTHWTEEGIKFSWKVMVAEKVGTIEFILTGIDPSHPNLITNLNINPKLYLTEYQYRMMAISPEQIVQFAIFLEQEYKNKSWSEIKIFPQSKVSLNGSIASPLISPDVNLLNVPMNQIPILQSPKDQNFEAVYH